MQVLLINPPFHRFFNSEQDYIPLGLSYLAATIKDCFVYNAEIIDNLSHVNYNDRINGQEKYIEGLNNIEHPIWRDIKAVIYLFQPKIIGIYTLTVKFKAALIIAKIAKEINPDIKVVLGGPHPTICPDECIEHDCIDSVVIGEGEKVFPFVVDNLLNNTIIKKYDMSINPISDIDKIQFPARNKMINNYSSNGYGHILTARGCPFNCFYCGSNSIWHSEVRFRSIKNIIKEMKQIIKEYHTNYFTIWDETFTLNRERILKFCHEVKKLKISWRCDTRVNFLDKELIVKMSDANMKHLAVGIESGNQETLDFINKKITVNRIIETANILNDNGINWNAYLMIGFPCETEEMIMDTYNLIDKINPTRITMSIFTPYPGTRLYDYCLQNGLIGKDYQYEKYSHQSKYNHFAPNIKPDRFDKLVKMFSSKIDIHNLEKYHAT